MRMTVWLAEVQADIYEPTTTVGVYTTKELAEEAILRWIEKEHDPGLFSIVTDHVLDEMP